MAISLFVHSPCSIVQAEHILDRLVRQRPDLFPVNFVISRPFISSDVDKEIAAEAGYTAETSFLVSLNDKSKAAQMKEVADLIRASFGQRRVLTLIENESPI